MVHMRRLEHNGVHGTKKGAMHPDPVSDDANATFRDRQDEKDRRR